MPPINASSATIHANNLTTVYQSLVGSSGSCNASSAVYFKNILVDAQNFINNLLTEAQSGHKISS